MTLYRPRSGYPAIGALPTCAAPPNAKRAMAQRVYRAGSSQLTSPNLFLILDAEIPNAPDYLPWHLYHCLSNLVSGAFAGGLRQYGAGPGRYAGYFSTALPTGAVTTDQLADWLRSFLGTSTPDQALYLLFPGPKTVLGEPGFQYGVDFCAYHTILPGSGQTGSGQTGNGQTGSEGNGQPLPYGVMPYPTSGGCTLSGALSDLDALCMTASHELAEAMTDTVPGDGETGPEGEIDDFSPCLWSPVAVSFDGYRYQIQAYWSNAANACYQPPTASVQPIAPGAIPV